MANLLYLVHRLPYPPNKGDKVRSYHLLKHLAARHRIFLGTFIDDPEDEIHIETVRIVCAGLHVARVNPALARVRSLSGFLTGQALSLAYYRDKGMSAWVARIMAHCNIDATVVFSSAMAQYAPHDLQGADATTLVDFVDVDSAKWTQYASQRPWPLSWVYAREGKRLLDYERALALRARRSFFVTEKETSLFLQRAPQCEGKVEAVGNGVDADFFSPDVLRTTPFADGSVPIVFTGAMDYWPNVDAVTWFVADVLPLLQQVSPQIRFHIVGRSPSPGVQALASDVVVVTGTGADVRPYLQHAAVVVAPMRIARGVQNKILEAMAMGRPVVAASDCVGAIDARPGTELVSASTAQDYVQAIQNLLQRPEYALAIGVAGRHCVVEKFSWDAHLSRIDRYLPQADSGRAVPM